MNHFERLKQQIRNNLLIQLVFSNLLLISVGLSLIVVLKLSLLFSIPILVLVSLSSAFLVASHVTQAATDPLKSIWLAILHVGPDHSDAPAPNLDDIKIGRELLTAMINLVYQMASKENTKELSEHRSAVSQAATIVSHLPLPLFVFNKEQIVISASNESLDYCKIESSDLFGKPLYDSLNLEFSDENTLEKWVLECQTGKVTDTSHWQRVHVRLADGELRQCDIAAYYNRDNPSGAEFIVTLFDRTKWYSKDDRDLSFVSLAVHELRTPLTMLKGYIEVFDEELNGKLTPELEGFMRKMIVSANQLGAFFNNILNVARVDQNQLTLNLLEDKWPEILEPAIEELQMKANAHNRSIDLTISPDLPTVAIDRISILEVINNLIDNAIKYGKDGDVIKINSQLNKQDNVETTVKDTGVGIPEAIIPHLFDKFYRSHRSAGKVGGTGLGLYISKVIVNAHGGEIWVQSTENEGSTFGFTLLPATKLAAELKAGNNKGIVRNAHGWIKNHSLYRR